GRPAMTPQRAALLWFATLATGVVLGNALSQRGPIVKAQQSPPPGSTVAAPAVKPSDETAIRRELAESYERFRAIDRTFVLVSRVVAPSVVHIVAKKTGPRENGPVGRFEESGSGVIVRGEGDRGLFVLTNHHVVENAVAKDVSILLHDGQ